DRFPQCLGHLRQRGVLVGVALVELGRLQLAGDAVQAGGDRRREREIWVGVGAGDAVLYPEAGALAAQAEAARAVVPADRDPRRRERARLVALVGVHAGRIEVRQLARHRHLPGQRLTEQRRRRLVRGALAVAGEERLASGLVPQGGVQVERR